MSDTETDPRPTCFVIGPIGEEGSDTRRQADCLLIRIIKPTLESDEFGYRVIRADDIDDPGLISDQVITLVTEADLVVADLNEKNPNAFYELAIRHMEEKPIIHMNKDKQKIPFDVQDFRAIDYNIDWPQSEEHARQELAKQVRAIRAADFRVSNPITRARGHQELARSSDPKDKIIAVMEDRLSRLEAQINADTRNKALPPLPAPIPLTTGLLGLGGTPEAINDPNLSALSDELARARRQLAFSELADQQDIERFDALLAQARHEEVRQANERLRKARETIRKHSAIEQKDEDPEF